MEQPRSNGHSLATLAASVVIQSSSPPPLHPSPSFIAPIHCCDSDGAIPACLDVPRTPPPPSSQNGTRSPPPLRRNEYKAKYTRWRKKNGSKELDADESEEQDQDGTIPYESELKRRRTVVPLPLFPATGPSHDLDLDTLGSSEGEEKFDMQKALAEIPVLPPPPIPVVPTLLDPLALHPLTREESQAIFDRIEKEHPSLGGQSAVDPSFDSAEWFIPPIPDHCSAFCSGYGHCKRLCWCTPYLLERIRVESEQHREDLKEIRAQSDLLLRMRKLLMDRILAWKASTDPMSYRMLASESDVQMLKGIVARLDPSHFKWLREHLTLHLPTAKVVEAAIDASKEQTNKLDAFKGFSTFISRFDDNFIGIFREILNDYEEASVNAREALGHLFESFGQQTHSLQNMTSALNPK